VFAGHFKDDRPFGEMRRFFPTGELRVIMNYYDDTGVNARARFFWHEGGLAAEGNYINTRRDSVWTYYIQGTQRILSSRVEYSDGKRNGLEQRFFPSGRVADETHWVDDLKHGSWRQYFENGLLRLATTHVNNRIDGEFRSYYPNGNIEIEGLYSNGVPVGNWIRYDENGNYMATVRYENGIITNLEELEEADVIFFRRAMESEQYIPEPTLDDLMHMMR
jgi:antitoxin component YwqK of YwqJK toxin-antitoxin module